MPDGRRVFIGIALSGGGSRAANFSAASLLELQRLGLLQRAAAISSVSGGSFAAAYYGIAGHDPIGWSEAELRKRLGYDFRRDWIIRWSYPHHILRYWFTPYDRGDLMSEVLQDVLFDGRPCRVTDMNAYAQQTHCDPHAMPGGSAILPRIVINASDLQGNNFTFTEEKFRNELGSRLDTYPLAHAIMASAAFPGAFQNVTLEDYRSEGRRTYKHLLDGGPTDNLGIRAILRMLEKVQRNSPSALGGCMLVLVDAFADPLGVSQQLREAHDQRFDKDPRRFTDFFFDDNLKDAFDDLLLNARRSMLEQLQYPAGKLQGEVATWVYQSAPLRGEPVKCLVWHLSFQRLPELEHDVLGATQLAQRANAIKTDLRLSETIHPRSSEERERSINSLANQRELQDVLYRAARILTRDDQKSLDAVRERVNAWGLAPVPSVP
jgi:predicted acylesterase/phospholipase RssA